MLLFIGHTPFIRPIRARAGPDENDPDGLDQGTNACHFESRDFAFLSIWKS